MKIDKVVTICSKFRFDYHKGKQLGMVNAHLPIKMSLFSKIVREYDQEIPQSQTADNPVAPRGRAAQPSRDKPIMVFSKRLDMLSVSVIL